MLTADVRVEGFDAPDWIALREIFGRGPRSAVAPRGGLVVLTRAGLVRRVHSTTNGRLDAAAMDASEALGAAARASGARWAIRLDRTALSELSDRFALRLERSDDLAAQTLKLLSVVRDLAVEGAVETWPRDARMMTIPSERVLLRALDTVCPVGKTLLAGAFEGSDVVTSIAAHRGEHGFDRILGPAEVRRELGLRSGDWARDCRGLARAVELAAGPLSLGCFAQASTFRRLFVDHAPGAWASAVAAREVVFHPIAPALAIPLGVDVGRAAVAVAKEISTRLGLGSFFGAGGPLKPAFDRVRAAAEHGELQRLLGFDPIALLRDLLGATREDR